MRILFLTYYFEPDLCAGSFRNTSLLKELINHIPKGAVIDVITTFPNRYNSFEVDASERQILTENVTVHRIKLPNVKPGLKGQILAFNKFYFSAIKLTDEKYYDIVYASSSRLFTAFLGARIARKKNAKLYLDIRDIFRESIVEIFKSKMLKKGLNIFLKPIESYTFGRANHINLVSKGFESYFKKYSKSTFSYYTNGIDQVFIDNYKAISSLEDTSSKKTIIYAGNMGEGQGLDKVIPQAAFLLPDYKFLLIGDGGTKSKLIEEIEKLKITNVELRDPISRNDLIASYQSADYLFLHLNDYKAFERVLPSKLFEYATFDKPIIAGVGGYAAHFIKKELPDTILFKPTDVEGMVRAIKKYDQKVLDKSAFVEKYDRRNINKSMAKSIIEL